LLGRVDDAGASTHADDLRSVPGIVEIREGASGEVNLTVAPDRSDEILKKPLVFGRGENPINFVSVKDVAAVVERAVTDPRLRGEVLEVGGPTNTTFNELAEVLQDVRGRHAKVRHVPRVVLRAMAPINRQPRAALAMDSIDMTFDALAAREAFADLPMTDIRAALSRVAAG